MDIERFTKSAWDQKRTREELETMRKNAVTSGRPDFAHIVDQVLCNRWPLKQRKAGGKTPTEARFQIQSRQFESGKDAYLWLVQRFCSYRPQVLDNYETLHMRAGSRSQGRRFARNPKTLFPTGSARHGNPSYYTIIDNGWYADINLSHDQKFSTLLQLSYLCELEYPRDWEFKVLGATQVLSEHQQAVVRAQKSLEDLLIE